MNTHLDLFSGIGGFALAARWAGFETVGFCEIEPYAQQVIIKNFGAVVAYPNSATTAGQRRNSREGLPIAGSEQSGPPSIHPDITQLDGTKYRGVTLLTGGFPCQPFSLAGKRGGASDNRFLWPQMLRVITEAEPRWIIAENVPGIINMELDRVLSDLEIAGYECGTLVVPACATDARHRRDRVWIVAHRQIGRLGELRGTPRESGHADGCDQALANSNGRQHQRSGAQSSERDMERCYGQEHCDVPNTPQFGSRAGLCEIGQEQDGCEPSDCGASGGDTRCTLLQGRCGEPASGPVERKLKSELRRVADGLPKGLDGSPCLWPEEDPATPRVATGIKNRAHRLRGLGNAIVPQVAYQIMRHIITIDQ